MTVTIKYFASLREAQGVAERSFSSTEVSTVADVIAQHKMPFPENTLISVNQIYAYPETTICSGDEVAFFPPVTGG